MSGKTPKNIAASIRQRLLNKARKDQRPFNELLQYFAMERFLYRLSQSPQSILAAALWTHYTSRTLSVPGAVQKWRETCLSSDEFSEIKNAWGDCERV